MGSPLQPLTDYVVTRVDKAESKTSSGLYLPDTAIENLETVKVVAVGPSVKLVKVGDCIVYKSYDLLTTKIKIDKQEYVIVKEEDILATVN